MGLQMHQVPEWEVRGGVISTNVLYTCKSESPQQKEKLKWALMLLSSNEQYNAILFNFTFLQSFQNKKPNRNLLNNISHISFWTVSSLRRSGLFTCIGAKCVFLFLEMPRRHNNQNQKHLFATCHTNNLTWWLVCTHLTDKQNNNNQQQSTVNI